MNIDILFGKYASNDTYHVDGHGQCPSTAFKSPKRIRYIMSTCLHQWKGFVLFLLWFLLLLLYLHDGHYLLDNFIILPEGQQSFTKKLQIKPNIAGTLLWISMTLFPIIYHYTGDNSNIVRVSSFAIPAVAFAINLPTTDYNGNNEYIKAIMLCEVMALNLYKQFSLYHQLHVQQSWFDETYKTIFDYRHLKFIIYLVFNASVYIQSCTFLDKCDMTHFLLSMHRSALFTFVIFYHLFPANIKYDLYFIKSQLVLCCMSMIIHELHCIIHSYFTKDYMSAELHFIFAHLPVLIIVISFIGIPNYILNRIRQRKFYRLLKRNNVNSDLWLDYIQVKQGNLQDFVNYLCTIKVYQNLLFIMEITQYKNIVLRRLGKETDNEYLQQLADYESIDGINTSNLVQSINCMDTDKITIKKIKSDISALYKKYMMKYDQDEYNPLFVTFISDSDQRLIQKKLQDTKDFEILNVFDDVIEKTNSIFQLLYREYVIQNDSN